MDEALAALGISLKDEKHVKVQLGIAGDPGSGKTHSILSSFPNVVVADFDRGTTAFNGKDITVFPFYDDEWCRSKLKAKPKTGVVDAMPIKCVNKRDAFRVFLREHAMKLDPSTTFFLDSWSKLQENVDAVTHCEPAYNNQGNVDMFSFWKRKLLYSEQVMADILALPCSVVVSFHLVREVDENGRVREKARPMQQGQFKEKVESYFDNFFVQRCVNKFDNKGEQKHLARWPEESKKLIVNDRNYLWQTRTSADVSAKCALPGVTDLFVPASYDSIKKAFSA